MNRKHTKSSFNTRTANRSDTFLSEDGDEDEDKIDGLFISVFGREKKVLISDLGENDKKDVLIETQRKLDPVSMQRHKEILNMGYEQARDSGVYKRTRQLFRIPITRGLPKWPASFELSGTKVCEIEKQACEFSDNEFLPLMSNYGRASTFPSRMRVSRFFNSDYGMRRQRTDTFSGYSKRGYVKDNLELEKELEEKARRHVYAFQVLGNARRGSPAVQSFTSLREATFPRRRKQLPVLSDNDNSPTGLMRMNTTVLSDKTLSDFKENRRQHLALVIRTRDNMGRQRITRDPLPEVSGRTLIAGSGFDI